MYKYRITYKNHFNDLKTIIVMADDFLEAGKMARALTEEKNIISIEWERD